ncbi:MAG: c-type cytochrome [Opitutus sp.]
MRRFLKFIAGLLVVVVALVAIAATFIYWKSSSLLKRTYAVTASAPKVPTDPTAIERGHHIAMTRGCLQCHGSDLAGAKVIDDPAMGRLFGPNLTRGRGGLRAGFRDEDYVLALRHGVGANGRGLFLMPSVDYAHFTEADMGDLVAYLKSVPPVDRDSVPLSIGPVARALFVAGKIKVSADLIDHANVRPSEVAPALTADYGKYVTATCTGCHGATLAGGKIEIGPPDWPQAANLTPHPSARVATWSESDFIATLKSGKRPDGTALNEVMPRVFGQMNDTELKAIWMYLKSLPPLPTGAR